MNKDYQYNPWPLGKVPEHLQRPEIKQLKELGWQFNDPREIIDIFENKVAQFAGSKYAVAVDCCTHAMELSLRYLMFQRELIFDDVVIIPNQTYISCALMLMQLGFYVQFEDIEWVGQYRLAPTRIWDSATMWTKDMYIKDSLQCISFQIKKRIPIGKGGMILCNSKEEYNWLKLASYDGRDLTTPYDSKEHIKLKGWHYYMTPEDAARGIMLMDALPKINEPTGNYKMYPKITEMLKK